MSLITRCPACGTMFNVVADQLRVSQGWVRCGHCSDVFDAGSHLQPAQPLAAPAAPAIEVPSGPVDVATNVIEVESPPPSAPVWGDPGVEHSQPSVAEPVATPAQPQVEPMLKQPDVPSPPKAAMEADRDADEPDRSFHDVSFLRQARRQAFWRKTSVRVASVMLGLALLAVLAGQWVVQHKDQLALTAPRWLPVIQAICQPLGCAVKPLRRVEALVIDSSSFTKSSAETFRLSFVLKNMADLPLELPLLELTLTDTQDKAILRRVLTPAQFGQSSGPLLPARAEVAGAVSFSVADVSNRPVSVTATAVAGYRVLVFYP